MASLAAMDARSGVRASIPLQMPAGQSPLSAATGSSEAARLAG